MKKFAVQYVRIEHQVYFLEVEAEDESDAEDVAHDEFTGSENYKVVHAEEFIQEELDELKEAVENNDIVGVLDAILDITYVGLGNGALVFGLKDKILDGYAEVQASNMSKVCKTEEEAQQTVEVRSKEQGRPCRYRKIGDNWIVYRDDMKVMKSINYFAPDLKKFF